MLTFANLRNPKLTIHLSKADVEHARALERLGGQAPYRGETCPVALAATRALRRRFRRHPNIRARVYGARIHVFEGPGAIGAYGLVDLRLVGAAKLGQELFSAMLAFDDHEEGEISPVDAEVELGTESSVQL